MELLLTVFSFFLLLVVFFFIGRTVERRHFRSLQEREAKLQHIQVSAERHPSPQFSGQPFCLVTGSVVISSDYFKTFAAQLKSIVGGRIGSFETLIERGRREAILRMKEQAAQQGAQAIFNVRLETSTLNQNKQKNSIICAELLAYGTAFKAPANPPQP
ncbi:MAG: YbjQ family protein [Cystobacterineae bacterium]|nr:YbjQ family protein [Cystobacterineae bacterium]